MCILLGYFFIFAFLIKVNKLLLKNFNYGLKQQFRILLVGHFLSSKLTV